MDIQAFCRTWFPEITFFVQEAEFSRFVEEQPTVSAKSPEASTYGANFVGDACTAPALLI